MRTGARHLLSWALLALLALSVPLAARPHEPPSRAELLLAAFALPDGSIPDLCGAGEADGAPKAYEARCSLCVLAKLAVLGPAPARPGCALAPVPAALPRAPRLALAAAWPQAPPARGPPPPLVA